MTDVRLLIVTHLLAAGAGFAIAPRELLESAVVHNGFFETDTKRVLAAAVESLRAENKLLVYSYKGFAAVSVERDGFLMLNGRQDLIVPATVSLFVDLSRLTAVFDETSRVITINLPPLVMGDVAFEPEGARTTIMAKVTTWLPVDIRSSRAGRCPSTRTSTSPTWPTSPGASTSAATSRRRSGSRTGAAGSCRGTTSATIKESSKSSLRQTGS